MLRFLARRGPEPGIFGLCRVRSEAGGGRGRNWGRREGTLVSMGVFVDVRQNRA